MASQFGLDASVIHRIRETLAGFPEIRRAVLYGSRAKGDFRPGSDIDLTLDTEGDTSLGFLYRVMEAIEELDLIYSFDISLFAHIENENLIEHIERVGVAFYHAETFAAEQAEKGRRLIYSEQSYQSEA
uniref:Nucleotidyltransferase domain-containing protein n=1 Tax=Candidatus Kentrum eta TaxID=2126337 RepID=A0A450UY89_9GAMM|nr:MAG: Nucleotidyltransferase domain-containing protein [Candidatus Kentron sp. H]VFJ97498.1 MAG: Nucleotidyltransferase domain-containing protein [Candidatus Kentron sp. H]VFK02817.1 MAG: Nucleotidyltransferase domain-containing protein [Candidatus Kentron sp. H]